MSGLQVKSIACAIGAAFLLLTGCAGPTVSWDNRMTTVRPVREVGAKRGRLVVKTVEQGSRMGDMDPQRRGFRVLDIDGREVYRVLGVDADYDSVPLAPGRYMVLSFVGDGLLDRHWEKAQVLIETGNVTVVDFTSPGPREILP